jgi:hypothetical protein
MFLDDDDTLRPQAVATLSHALHAFPEAMAAFGDHTFTDLSTGEHHPNHFEFLPHYARFRAALPIAQKEHTALYGRSLYKALLFGNLLGQPWVVRAEAYRAIGGFQRELGSADDWDVYLRLLRRHPVCVTTAIVSDHFREAGRSHLTTDDGQATKQMAVITMELARAGHDIYAQLVLRRRMAMYFKATGDVAPTRHAALRAYATSACWWPFDATVVARTMAWTLESFFERNEDHHG